MALPHDSWLEIKAGPGTWMLVQALFREEDNDPRRLCEFKVIDPEKSKRHSLKVQVRDVHRMGNGRFMVRGTILMMDNRDWENLSALQFLTHYIPERREGLLKIISNRSTD